MDELLTLHEAAALIPGANAGTLKRGRTPDLTKLVSPEQAMRVRFDSWVHAARTRTKKRGLTFNVTAEFLASMAAKQNFRCALSGLEFSNHAFQPRDPFSPSVDRLDNARGYETDNVRLVCLIVNIARSDFGDDALIKMAKAIAAVTA